MRVERDIRRAWTLPSAVYTDPAIHERVKDRIFARSWQLVADSDAVGVPGQAFPFTLLEGCLDEPLLLTRDADGRIHGLSNVCTHRGNLVVDRPSKEQVLRCRYHGRRFALDGRFLSMPEFDRAADFPSPVDDLPRVSLGSWEKFLFVSLDPAVGLEELLAPVRERVGWLPLHDSTSDPARHRDYLVEANWALYCENYLEGFHIPYVHPDLSGALDHGGYRTELFSHASLQVAMARDDADVFDLPADSPDRGQLVAAYYFWLFPNTMLNFYPWGLSINVVKPLAVDRTRVSFLSYVLDPSRLDCGAGGSLDRVEREDEEIVENVQRGVRSRLYRSGRFSPEREAGVHHFQRLLARSLNEGEKP